LQKYGLKVNEKRICSRKIHIPGIKRKMNMREYFIKDIADITGGKMIGDSVQPVSQVSIDSRTLVPGPGVLFFAIRGERHDGHRFISELYQSGVRNFVVGELPHEYDKPEGAAFIVVKDTLVALQALAAFHRSQYSCPVLGITGSNGKTVVKEWLFQMLRKEKNLCRSPKSFNSQVGVPLSVLLLDEQHEMGIFEAGISKTGEMGKLQAVIRPGIGIMTNIGEAHQENFTSIEQKVAEKIILFKDCHAIIYCADHILIDSVLRERYSDRELVSWSEKNESTVTVTEIQLKEKNTHVRLKYSRQESYYILPFIDRASVENALHIITLLLHLGYKSRFIEKGLLSLSPVAMRLELVKGINGCTLINDSYNSDLYSLSIALDFLNQQNQHKTKTVILSDILQSGRSDEDLYREVSALVKGKGIDHFIGIGKRLAANRQAFLPGSVFFESTEEFLAGQKRSMFRDEAILIKGSRQFRFEKIVHAYEQKVHCTVMEVDLEALVHNLNIYRSLLDKDTRIMVMVKALSYGSGSWEIANVLQFQKVDYLCVAYIDEGIHLREAGIKLPVMVMNPEMSGFEALVDYQLEPEIYSFRILHGFNELVSRRGIDHYPVHLKLETGMHRLGFSPEQMDELVSALRKAPRLVIASVFSHLAAADNPVHDLFTRDQIRQFEQLSEQLTGAFSYRIIRHMLNSSGIERFPEGQFDMVRLGIGLYGISETITHRLRNVNTLKSIISQIKTVKKGSSVGYNRQYMAGSDMTMGIIPIGYADGLSRKLGNGNWRVSIKGQAVPLIGNICMDMCMVDLTGTDAVEGDEVIIFGEDPGLKDLAEKTGTIPYEVLSRISERVKRVYIH